jgi:SAM-dependent MidA family methyltransferase
VTAILDRLVPLIAEHGPIGVDRYMAICLADPDAGYYRIRDPLGVAGDFVTAPEISQIFGEIIGAWLAERWGAMGRPDPVHLVELGPGRGTLMGDILRILGLVPGCLPAIRLHLVETSPALRQRQRDALPADPRPCWHETLEAVPDGPMLLVANEFFDALPIRQAILAGGVWRERMVGIDPEGALTFVAETEIAVEFPAHDLPEGSIVEIAEVAASVAGVIGDRLSRYPGAALVIDYGHLSSAVGETLQAVRAHRFAPVLADPGEADLSAHVDFAALARALAPAEIWGPVTQGAFLVANGAALREAALCRGQTPEAAAAIRRDIRRLLDPAAMGRLFKVLAATSPGLTRPAGF